MKAVNDEPWLKARTKYIRCYFPLYVPGRPTRNLFAERRGRVNTINHGSLCRIPRAMNALLSCSGSDIFLGHMTLSEPMFQAIFGRLKCWLPADKGVSGVVAPAQFGQLSDSSKRLFKSFCIQFFNTICSNFQLILSMLFHFTRAILTCLPLYAAGKLVCMWIF